MTKRTTRKKPANPGPPSACSAPTPGPPSARSALVADSHTIARAILDLHINVPVYRAEVVRDDAAGDHLVLHCFGGRVATWTPPQPKTGDPCSGMASRPETPEPCSGMASRSEPAEA